MLATRSLPILLACLLTAGSTGAADEGTAPVLGLRDRTPRITAFVGATVVVSPERTVEDAVLVLRDGRVAAVGTDVHPPADARVIEARGLRIYPGFVDPLTEYGLQPAGGDRAPRGENRSSAPDYVGQRVGLDAWNDAVHAEIDWVDRFRPDAEAAKLFLARGVTAVQSAWLDGILRGRAFVATLDTDDEPGRVVLEPASLQMASFDKGSSTQAYPSSLMGSIALLRQAFLDAAWYRRASEAWRRDRTQQEPERNRALEALAANERPIVFETTDELSLLRAGRISAEFDVPLIHVGSNMEFEWLDEVAALGQPIILPLDFPERPDVASADAALDVDLGRLRRWERAPRNAAVLTGAGVRIAFTGHGLGPKDDMLAAVRRTIDGGLDEATALAALTVVPAGMCGVGDLVGTLEPGHRADLIVADGDLLTDDRSRIRTVWIGGVETASFVPLDQADFRGVWSVELAGHAAELTLSGKIDAPKGRLVAGEAKARIGDVDSERRKLRFRASLEPLGVEGIGRFVLDSAGAGVSGTVWLPGDRRAALTLTRTGDAPRKDDDDEDAQGAEADDGPVGRLTHPDVAFGLAEPIAPRDVLVRNATVWTLEGPGRLDGADLLVRDGRIAAVGRGLAAPAGIRVIDATGKHVTPGIIDEHSHLAISRGVNEGSHAVTAEVRIGDVVNADDIGIYRALAGGVTTAQLLHGSANPIGGQSQIIKMRWGSPPEALKFAGAPPSIKFALGENVKQSNWGAGFRTRYPQSRMGVETIMRDAFLAAREYREAGERWNALPARQRERTVPPRRDLRLDTLLEILDGERFVHCHSYRQSEVLMLMRLAESLGWRVQTFTHILEGYKVAPEMAAHGAGGSSFADWWAFKYEVYDAIPYNTCLMHDAGVVTSINSDSEEAIRRLNQEAGKSVMYCGMDQVEALRMATLNPAIQLRIDDRVGSLAPGKDADFVIWSGPPLSVLSRVEQTWVDGAPLFDVERDAAERTAIARERDALVQKALHAAGPVGHGGDRSAEREPEWHCDDVEDVWHEAR